MATKTFNARIANKRDTSANWTSNNPVLLNGEVIIVDTEAGQVRYKVGNGTSTYTQLPFTDESLITNINGKLSLSGGTMTGNIDMGGHKLTGLGAPVNPNDAVRQTDLKVVSDEVDGIIAGTTGITLAPATTTKIGGVIVGDGIEVETDGTISTNPVPAGGTNGQILTQSANGPEWQNAPSGLPEGGTEGQMLYKSADGAAWGDKPVMYVTVTQSSDGRGHKVDKDAGEIKAAYEAGSSVFLVWDRNDLGKDDWQVIPLSAMDISANGNHYARFLNLRYSAVVDVDGDVDITEVVFTSSEITYNNSNSGLTSTNAQDAINEVQENVENVLPSGGTTGQLLTKTETGEAWQDGEFLPSSGGTVNGYINFDQANSGIYFSKFQDEHSCYPTIRSTTIDGKVALSIYTKAHNGVGNTVYPIILTGVDTPKKSNDAANKIYVDGELNNFSAEISNELDAKLTTPTGTQGQLLGFTADNTVGAVDAPESGLTQEQADARYLQLSGGTLTGALTLNGEPTEDLQAAPKQYVDALKPLARTITLTAAGWSSNAQTVTVPGVVASETAQLITPTPAIASQSAYYEAGIMCTGQAANSLRFTCQTVPTSNLTVYVVIQPLG